MDNISKENVQEMDPEAGQAMESNDEAKETLPNIFGNRVILNRILEQLPNRQLLKLSLVNKLWKKEARIVMKKRGSVMVLLKSNGVRKCGQVLEAFAENLETLTEDFYSGMTICLSSVVDCEGTGAVEVEAIHESILARMRGNLKHLSILFQNPPLGCWNARDCPSFLLLRLLLRDFIGDLECLTLKIQGAFDNITEPFIGQFFPHCSYPKLKVLKLKDELYDYYLGSLNEGTFENQIRMLLSWAPNLQKMQTYGLVSLRENLLEGREGVVHLHESAVQNPMQDISENAIPALRLKRIMFVYKTGPEVELDRFNLKAQSLLRTCCATTLEWLRLDMVSAVLFMSYGIRLVNVKDLWIGFDYYELEQLDPRIMSIMARFDFTCFLPNLIKVDIVRHTHYFHDTPILPPDQMTTIIEQANSAVQKEPTVSRAGNIKYLDFTDSAFIPTSALQFFAHMFPVIQELNVENVDTEEKMFPVKSAWELWPDLRLIKVDGKLYQRP